MLDTASSRAQVGRPGRFFGNGRLHRAMAYGAASVAVVVALIAAPTLLDRFRPLVGGAPVYEEPMVWDPVDDFRRSPNELNPSPDSYANPAVWSYLWSETGARDPTRYNLMSRFTRVDQDGSSWSEPGLVNLIVGHAQAQQVITLHPWSASGAVADRRNAILGWQSPVSGQISMTGLVRMEASECTEAADGVTFSIDRGDQTLTNYHLALGEEQSFQLTATVGQHELLYFISDSGANAWCDTTFLSVRIIGG